MKTKTRTIAILATVAAVTVAANAQIQDREEQRPGRKPAGFDCPVCGSPCVSKATVIKQHRQRMQANARPQQFRPHQAPQGRQRMQANARPQQFRPHQAPQGRQRMQANARPQQFGPHQAPQGRQRMQANARPQQSGPKQAPQVRRHRADGKAKAPAEQQSRRNQPQRGIPFDLDRDGKLSQAERAARKAYHDALVAAGEAPKTGIAPRPQAEE